MLYVWLIVGMFHQMKITWTELNERNLEYVVVNWKLNKKANGNCELIVSLLHSCFWNSAPKIILRLKIILCLFFNSYEILEFYSFRFVWMAKSFHSPQEICIKFSLSSLHKNGIEFHTANEKRARNTKYELAKMIEICIWFRMRFVFHPVLHTDDTIE